MKVFSVDLRRNEQARSTRAGGIRKLDLHVGGRAILRFHRWRKQRGIHRKEQQKYAGQMKVSKKAEKALSAGASMKKSATKFDVAP